MTYSGSEIKAYHLEGGNIYSNNVVEEITVDEDKSIHLSRSGRENSERYEKPWYKDNIVRVNATDEEIKQFFEDLTRGTSMATKKENMTIIE